MAETVQYVGPELVLRFENERPIKAAAFARVLRDLASDYKRHYRDDLVIVALPEGSLVAKLRSLSKFAEASNHIFEFGKNLATIFAAGAVGFAALNGQHAHDDGQTPLKSAQSLATLAVQSQSRLQLTYIEPGKQEIVVDVGPEQARQVNIYVRNLTAKRLVPSAPELPPRSDAPLIGSRTADVDALAELLLAISQRPGGFGDLDPEVRSLLTTLVLALQEAAPYRVTQLVMELEASGHSEAAGLIREITGRGNGNSYALLPRS